MSAEFWTSASDVLLAVGTFFMSTRVKHESSASPKTWNALFISLGFAAACGALYHGINFFKVMNMWTLTSAASTASIFIFLACCFSVGPKKWQWIGPLWPMMSIIGIVVGGMISTGPFYYVSIVAGVVGFCGIFVVAQSNNLKARNFIWSGFALTILGLILQKVCSTEGAFNNNVLFHLAQLGGNGLFLMAANSSKQRQESSSIK